MKKGLLLFAAVCSMGAAVAQCTINGANTQPGISPASASFPAIERGVATNATHTMQVYLPASFTIPPIPVILPGGGTITVQSIQITSIGGLPNGITYACNPTNCTVAGGSNGCIALNGTTSDPAASYPLSFTGPVCLTNVPVLGDTCVDISALPGLLALIPVQIPGVPDFTYSVRVTNPNSARDLNAELEASMKVYPNPAKGGSFNVYIASGNDFDATLSVVNSVGQLVYNEKIEVNGIFNNSINLGSVPAGIYAVQLKTENGFAVKTLVIE